MWQVPLDLLPLRLLSDFSRALHKYTFHKQNKQIHVSQPVIRAQDTSYAAWTLAKHSPPPKQTEEQKQLAEAMSRLW